MININPEKKNKIKLSIVFATFVAYLLVLLAVAFNKRLDGDEGQYLYLARLLSEGQIPILDYFTLQNPSFLLVYAVFIKLFGVTTVEQIRLLSVILCFVTGILFFAIVNKLTRDRLVTYLAFLLFAFNLYYIRNNVYMIHFAVSNSFLFFCFYVLFQLNGSLKKINYSLILGGVFYALALFSRTLLILPLGGLIFVWMVYLFKTEKLGWKLACLNLLLFVVGVILGSLFPIYIMFSDWDAFYFSTWSLYVHVMPGLITNMKIGLADNVLHPWLARYSVLKLFVFGEIQNIILVMFGLVGGAYILNHVKKIIVSKEDRILLFTFIFFIGITSVYLYAWTISYDYLNQSIPYLAILSVPGLQVLLGKFKRHHVKRVIYAMVIVYFILLAGVSVSRLYAGGWRNSDSFYSLKTTHLLSAEIKKITREDETVLSWNFGAELFESGRNNLKGFEQGAGHSFFISNNILSDDQLNRFKMLSKQQLENMIQTSKIPVIVVSPIIEPEYYELIRNKYIQYKNINGHEIYLSKNKYREVAK